MNKQRTTILQTARRIEERVHELNNIEQILCLDDADPDDHDVRIQMERTRREMQRLVDKLMEAGQSVPPTRLTQTDVDQLLKEGQKAWGGYE